MGELGDLSFTAAADSIRAGARHAVAAAEGAAELRLGTVAAAIGHALRGGRSAVAARELSMAWDRAVSTWTADVAAHARRLTDSAARYEADDGQAGAQFDTTGPDPV